MWFNQYGKSVQTIKLSRNIAKLRSRANVLKIQVFKDKLVLSNKIHIHFQVSPLMNLWFPEGYHDCHKDLYFFIKVTYTLILIHRATNTYTNSALGCLNYIQRKTRD